MGAFFVYNNRKHMTKGRRFFMTDKHSEMETIKDVLQEKDEIKNNPFAVFPNKNCKAALKLLEEYSEEINDFKGL